MKFLVEFTDARGVVYPARIIQGERADAERFAVGITRKGGQASVEQIRNLTATIVRRRVYATPGRNPRFAWRWLYDVRGLDVTLEGFDRLATARRMAREHGAGRVIEQWKYSKV